MSSDPWQAPQAPQQPAHNPMRPNQGTSPLAIASLVLGIASFPGVLCCSCIAMPMPTIGAILGFLAFRDAKQTGGGTNQTLAIAGMVTNGLAILLTVIFFIFAMVVHGVENMSDFSQGGVMDSWEQPADTYDPAPSPDPSY